MTLIIFIALLGIAAALLIFKKKRWSLSIALLAFVFLWTIGSGILFKKHIDIDQTPQTWGSSNIIILLGQGIVKRPQSELHFEPGPLAHSAILKTALLYQDCKKKQATACKILISGGDPHHYGMTEAQVYSTVLHALDIPEGDLILETNSKNTFQNAQLSRSLIPKNAYDTMRLVTFSHHMQRSLLYFAHFGMRPIPIETGELRPHFSPIPTAYHLLIADLIIHETIGAARYFLYTVLGWNPPSLPIDMP